MADFPKAAWNTIPALSEFRRERCGWGASAVAQNLVSLQELRNTAGDRWDLSGGAGKQEFPEGWFTVAELLEMRQGVTPGGCLDVFLLDKKKAEHRELEGDLVRKAVKSKQLSRWRVEWKDRELL